MSDSAFKMAKCNITIATNQLNRNEACKPSFSRNILYLLPNGIDCSVQHIVNIRSIPFFQNLSLQEDQLEKQNWIDLFDADWNKVIGLNFVGVRAQVSLHDIYS